MTLQNNRSYFIARARYLRLTRKLNTQINNLNNLRHQNGNGNNNYNYRRHITSRTSATSEQCCWDMDNNPAYSVYDNEMITSFENPNYHLNDDDALNSNIPTPLSPCNSQYYQSDSFYQDSIPTNSNSKRRKNYGNIDLSSMGVDLDRTVQTPDSECSMESRRSEESMLRSDGPDTSETSSGESDDDDITPEPKRTSFLEYYSSLDRSVRHEAKRSPETTPARSAHAPETTEKSETTSTSPSTSSSLAAATEARLRKCINSPDSNDSGIQADEPGVAQAKVTPTSPSAASTSARSTSPANVLNTSTTSDDSYRSTCSQLPNPAGEEVKEVKRRSLPPGWEKHEDEDGAYYWHVKSGTIQRETPTRTQRPLSIASDISLATAFSTLSSPSQSIPDTPSSYGSAQDQDHLSEFEGHAFKYASESLRTLCSGDEDSPPIDTASTRKPVRFAVRSLGWLQIADEDLTPERSSKAVNRCIMDLSLGRNDFNDAVGRWGDGKDLYMHLDDQYLTLVDTQDLTVLNKQTIQAIRVWGVGRDNGRDFAYVARDRVSRKHMCHVFRCDTPARHIANTLRDICRKLMSERSQRLGLIERDLYDDIVPGRNSRPTYLPNLEKTSEPNGQKITFQNLYKRTSFPTPMEEPKKLLRAHYLGSVPVPRPGGVEMLNTAMEEVHSKTPASQWQFVNVAVAPSTITISEISKPDIQITECRVRFLSFMGIAMNNAKLCSFIMHTAADSFVAHVFHCEPSAGTMCKTIEAACKLRYQKCLDAHHPSTMDQVRNQQARGLRSSLKKVLGSISRNQRKT